MYHASVWTGAEMIVWGGQDISGNMLNSGARFRPATGLWTATTTDGAAGKRQFWRPDLGIWTGEAMLIAGGSDYPASLDSTYQYFPEGEPPPPPSTNCIAPPSGLVAWWSFDGTAVDTMNGIALQLSGDPTYGAGKVAQGLRFDGSNDEA